MIIVLICLIIVGVILTILYLKAPTKTFEPMIRAATYTFPIITSTPPKTPQPFFSASSRAVFLKLSADYFLSPTEKQHLYGLLRRNPQMSLLDAIRALVKFEGLSDLKKFFMITYIMDNCKSRAEKSQLRTQLETMRQQTLDEETFINIRDYLERNTPVISPFSQPVSTNLPFEIGEVVELDFFQGLPRHELENQERLLRYFEEAHRKDKKKPKVIYDQRENVHNSEVNSSVVEAARKLIDKFGSRIPSSFDIEELRAMSKNKEKFNKAYNRIVNTDKSVFSYDKPFTLRDVFGAVISFILQKDVEERKQLFSILADELERKSMKCGTGNLAALVSSIQGFQNEFEIKIGIEEEVFARVSKYFADAIQRESREDIIEDMGSEDKTSLIKYINSKRAALFEELQKEYTGVELNESLDAILNKSLYKYTMISETTKCFI